MFEVICGDWRTILDPIDGDIVQQIQEELEEIRAYILNGSYTITIKPVK